MTWKILAPLAAALALGVGAGAAQGQTKCWGPTWQRVTDPRMGISAEFTADTYLGYGASQGAELVTLSRSERARSGGEIPGRCSNFSVTMNNLGGRTISNAEGLFDAEQRRYYQGLRDAKLLSSRRLTVQGFPAREFSYSFTIDVFYTTATHRVLLVARGDRFYVFDSSWGDGGPTPSDSVRAFNSIQFTPLTPDPNLRSQALLSMTINEYWRYYPSKSRDFFTPQLKAIAEPKRAQESEIVKAYGYFENPQYLRMENGWRVFRIKHDKATVDWYIQDDGHQISGLTWRKVSP